METVRRLTREVQFKQNTIRSLRVLRYLKERINRTKSGIMLGLGEQEEEVYQT
jgi:lipoic acid synthetase